MLSARDERTRVPCALLMGGFDGLHRGHVRLLDAAKATGLPVGIMTIAGNKAGGELFTPAERRHIFCGAGIAFVREFAFTDAFRATPPEAFLRDLFACTAPRVLICGEDFRFGRDAAGTPSLLERLAPCPVQVLPAVMSSGEKISTSRIKACIANADMGGANALLLSPYFVGGRVEHGRHVGGPVLGFPTVNITVPPEKVPPRDGVYAGHAETPAGSFPAIVNFGKRPTFGVEEKKAEAYLHGFSGDLYGADVRIFPERFLRPVMKFESAEALRAQLERDREELFRVP